MADLSCFPFRGTPESYQRQQMESVTNEPVRSVEKVGYWWKLYDEEHYTKVANGRGRGDAEPSALEG